MPISWLLLSRIVSVDTRLKEPATEAYVLEIVLFDTGKLHCDNHSAK
jgi:hypothetical protein